MCCSCGVCLISLSSVASGIQDCAAVLCRPMGRWRLRFATLCLQVKVRSDVCSLAAASKLELFFTELFAVL